MSAMDPSGSAQPSQNQAYEASGNPAEQQPAEKSQAAQNAKDDSATTEQRIPQQQSSYEDAEPSAMGKGIRGAGPGEDPQSLTEQEKGESGDVDAEQMGAPGEGKVADAVGGNTGRGGGKAGGGGSAPGLETDMDRKKAEQAPKREEMKKEQDKDVDVGGVLGQRSAPADPTT